MALDEETIKANARFFDREEDVPRYAISMGIKTIMLARRVILLASGAAKAEAVRKTLCSSVTPKAPASILQLHQDVTIILDKEAAALLPKEIYGVRIDNYKAIVPALSIDKASSWPFNEAGDMRSRLL